MDVSNFIHLSQINLVVPLRVAAEWAVSVPITIEVGVLNLHRAHLSEDIDLLSFRLATCPSASCCNWNKERKGKVFVGSGKPYSNASVAALGQERSFGEEPV